ncbi:MAG: CaiB/BaiF CoA-transferase family protein [Hellea sp.]
MSGPLTGFRIIELAGIGPGPYAGQLLADMGAEVIVVHRPGFVMPSIDGRGKKSIVVDIRQAEGADIVKKLCETADALIEGLRPGVTERLGVGPEDCQALNPKLVYGRMTGWGQTGPWAKTAGHDINYISITGALEAMGKKDNAPFPPLNFVGDYGGGTMFLVTGVLAALLQAQKTGKGDIVDAAIIDGTSSMMGIVYSLHALGQWRTDRQSNLLDGAMPYYRCYQTQDQKYMAVGCIEPQFFAIMMDILKVDTDAFGPQNNPKLWAEQHQKLEAVFASKPRDEWAALFDGTDACVTPVLTYLEAPEHPQNSARGGLAEHSGRIHPGAAPQFSSSENRPDYALADPGGDTRALLTEAGFDDAAIETLIADKTVIAKD